MDTQLTERPTKPIKLNKKQRLFIDYWIEPTSETFGNAYKSALRAGFAPKYSMNMTGQAPKWLSESINKMDLHPEHIKQGVQKIATTTPNSKSPDDTRLKAYEMLARFNGMLDNKNTVNVQIVQPILGGMSNKTTPKDTHVIDQES